ncbi:MAG: sialidase family protein [bacterium]
MSQNNQNKTNNNKNMMVKQTQTEQTTAQTKTKKRLKLMVWSVFIISALAVAGAAVLPVIPKEEIRESDFQADELSGEPTVYVPGKYIKHNTPYDMTTFNIEGDYEQLPRYNNAIENNNGIVKVTSEVIDTASFGDENSAATGLSKVAFTALLSPLNSSLFGNFLGSNNELEFFLRGTDEQFDATTDDSIVPWYSTSISTNGFHVISVPSTVTYNWQYVQFGFRLNKGSYYRPKVGNVVYQVLEQRCTTTETECTDNLDNDCDSFVDEEDFDCEEVTNECGNDVCEEGENHETCPEDCEEIVGGWYEHEPIIIDSTISSNNCHYNSGGRRMVRINDTIVTLASAGSYDHTYRSTDNGETWTRIDTDGIYSSSLISGPNEMVYHFYRDGDNLKMVKFGYNETPPSPQTIYTNSSLSESSTGVYRSVNATVDESGTLYVATHWGSSNEPIYLLKSIDGGNNWSDPYTVSSGSGIFYYPHFEVTSENVLVATYSEMASPERELWFAKSSNQGETWTRTSLSDENTSNPAILTVGANQLFVFAQSTATYTGLVFKQSDNLGDTWTEWQLIEETCGYSDPSPGLGADGQTIYVASRSSKDTGISGGSCGDRSRPKMLVSPDLGETWQTSDDNYDAERGGCKYPLRYQTWWNYGGPVEWTWTQQVGGSYKNFYDVNLNAEIGNENNR